MGRWPFFESQRASFPAEVVLPEPCSPTIRNTLGGSLAKRSLDSWLPRILISSSWTILVTCWAGERAVRTSSPMAFTLMFSMSCLTTLKLTSASSSAMRISRKAPSMFSAESFPSPRRFLKTRCSFSDRLSNMRAELRRERTPRGRSSYYSRLCGGNDADAARRHFPGAVHPQFVDHPRARPQIRRQALCQPRHVEEDISSTIVRPQKPEAFGFEVCDHGAGLLARGRFSAGVAGLRGRLPGPAAFVSYPLLDQRQVVFGPTRGLRIGRHLQVRIALAGLFKHPLLECVQGKYQIG